VCACVFVGGGGGVRAFMRSACVHVCVCARTIRRRRRTAW